MQSDLIQTRGTAHPGRRTMALLGLSLAIAGLVCFAQVRGSAVLLALLLAAFLGLTILAADWHRSFPLLLFFLPWSPLLKLNQGGTSFFTLAMLLACVIHFAREGWRLRPYQIFCAAALMVLTLLSKALHGYSLSMGYLFFIVMLVLFPSISGRDARDCTFLELTLFFAVGIISAALIARQIADYPRIRPFVVVDSYLTITRLSGFYGDPNFYSAHITACFAGIQLLLVREKRRITRLLLFVLAGVLIYCGLLSASKSFVIVLVCQFFFWVLLLLERSNRGSTLFRVVLGVACAAAIMLSSSAVEGLLRTLDTRFSYSANVAQITTGRTKLWAMYLREFVDNPLMLILGEGFTIVNINGRASHNTILQGIYQLGLIGFPILLVWLAEMVRPVRQELQLGERADRSAMLLMLSGVALPWFGIDILFFDELFLLPLYAVIGVIYAAVPAPSYPERPSESRQLRHPRGDRRDADDLRQQP